MVHRFQIFESGPWFTVGVRVVRTFLPYNSKHKHKLITNALYLLCDTISANSYTVYLLLLMFANHVFESS